MKITLAGKDFEVEEIAIGKRKFLVPAIRNFYRELNKKPEALRFELEENEYDTLLEIAFRAIFPKISKDEFMKLVITEAELLNASFTIADQCGLKPADKKAGENLGETEKALPSTGTA